jgi:hypothetical protein
MDIMMNLKGSELDEIRMIFKRIESEKGTGEVYSTMILWLRLS